MSFRDSPDPQGVWLPALYVLEWRTNRGNIGQKTATAGGKDRIQVG